MWVELNDSILAEAFNGSELAKVTQRRGVEAVDPMPSLLEGVASLIRGRIRSGGRTQPQGEATFIPQELWSVATDIVRYRVLLRFALDISEPRKLAWQQAQKTLEDISSGAYVLADEGEGKLPAPHIVSRPAYWGPRAKRGGIM